MNHIEKLIKKSWSKIPEDLKDRILVRNFDIVLVDEYLNEGDKIRRADHILFSQQAIERNFQDVVDDMVIKALNKQYGFNEDDAHRLVKSFSE
jgi:predicted Zn-dependent protease with MMP-like domain